MFTKLAIWQPPKVRNSGFLNVVFMIPLFIVAWVVSLLCDRTKNEVGKRRLHKWHIISALEHAIGGLAAEYGLRRDGLAEERRRVGRGPRCGRG